MYVIVQKSLLIDIGEPGSIHDSRMLRKSPLYAELSTDPSKLHHNAFLLGDSAYASTNWIVPPFKNNRHLSRAEVKFNVHLSRTRIYIENSFALLKGRFRRVQNFENNNIKFIVKATVAACIIHNLCQDYDDMVIEEYVEPAHRNLNNDAGLIDTHAKRNTVFQQWRLDTNM